LRQHLPKAVFFDADACVQELLTRPDIVGKISTSLGTDLQAADGSLDRNRTSALVFQDDGKRHLLEEILHPLVRQTCMAAQLSAQAAARFFVADIPLFYETGFPFAADHQIVIACDPRTQRERLMARSPNHAPHQIDSRLAAQIPILEKANRATVVLWNGGTKQALTQQTQIFIKWLLQNSPPLLPKTP
jgi:dephospho-CoA kinase